MMWMFQLSLLIVGCWNNSYNKKNFGVDVNMNNVEETLRGIRTRQEAHKAVIKKHEKIIKRHEDRIKMLDDEREKIMRKYNL